VIGQQPAGAATHHAEKPGSITFGDFTGVNVNCTFDLITNLDVTAKTLTAGADLSGAGAVGSECFDVDGELVLDYRDSHGNARHFEADYSGTATVKATGVASNVKVTLIDTFLNCDQGTNATCTATIVVAPK
jgi:hypothetical protein